MLFSVAFMVVWRSLKDAWEDAFLLAVNNLIWLLFSIAGPALAYGVYKLFPVPAVIWSTIAIAVLVLPLATAGMFHVTNRTARGYAIHVSDLFEGIKRYWWRSWLWLLASAAALGLVYISLGFYTNLVSGFLQILVGGFWLGIGLVWILMQFYFWPLLIEQSTPNMLRAWRNAFILVVREPLYSLVIVFCVFLLTGLSIIFSVAFMVAYMAIVGLIANNATLVLLIKSGAIEAPRSQLKI
ncbi:MAG: YesL family protein [Anaerolineae bacterium]